MQLGECMTKYLALAFLIMGFLVGDGYGDEGRKGCFLIVWYNTLQFTGHF